MWKSVYSALALALAAAVVLDVANSSFVTVNGANGTKYHISNVQLEFNQAFAQCKRYGWALATERTPEATQAINNAITAVSGADYNIHFMGGFLDKGGAFYPSWIWLDDGKDFDYTNWWGGNESTSTIYDCLARSSVSTYFGQWSPVDCSESWYFICES